MDARIDGGTTPLVIASSNGHAAVVRELLARGADVNARSDSGSTALHVASYCGRAEAMRELLKRPDVDINAQDDNGDTPLFDTCSQGRLMAATILIGAGANLALVNNAGDSALSTAEERVAEDEVEVEDEEEDESEDTGSKRERLKARERLHEQHRFLVATLRMHGAT